MWIIQNGMNILIILAVASYGAYVIRNAVKQKKIGGCTGCGSTCSGCNSCQTTAYEQGKVIRISKIAH